MYLTWLDNNSWLIELGEQRILLDPWLVGSLVFGNQTWLFTGQHKQPRSIPESIDLLLLSQGLEDHAHPETLEAIDRSIPVVASPNGAKVAAKLGYRVTALAHGETFVLNDRVKIRAVPGSPIGPLLTENGYLLTDLQTGTKLYYEPHGYHSPTLKAHGPVDVVITPIVTLKVPLLGAIIQGKDSAPQVIDWLQPKAIIPTAAGGQVEFGGMLAGLIRAEGSPDALQAWLAQHAPKTQLVMATPGDRFQI